MALAARNLVIPALFWIYLVALRTLNTPLDVDIRISFVTHELLDHFQSH